MKSTKDLLLLLLVLAGAAGAGFWVLQMDAGSILPQQQTQADQATTAAGGAFRSKALKPAIFLARRIFRFPGCGAGR